MQRGIISGREGFLDSWSGWRCPAHHSGDFLKDLSMCGNISEEVFAELRQATDLSLRSTKQAAHAIGRFMGAMVTTERHLLLNLTDIKEKDSFSPGCSRIALGSICRLNEHRRQ